MMDEAGTILCQDDINACRWIADQTLLQQNPCKPMVFIFPQNQPMKLNSTRVYSACQRRDPTTRQWKFDEQYRWIFGVAVAIC